MMPLLALLLAVSPDASPDNAILDAFKSACASTGDMEKMKADAIAAGWLEMADDADPRIARLIGKGREEAGPEAKVTGLAFRRREGAREYFLVQSRAEAEGYWGVGCRVYDFAAAEPIDPALIHAWMGKPPTGVEEPAPGLSRRLWEPGWRPGMTVEASHVPPGHPLGQKFGLQGNILVALAIGGF